MGGMLKHVFWIAPLAVIILISTWYLSRENTVDMRVQDQEFNRDWNESMAMMSKKSPVQAAKHLQRATVAQTRYSSALNEQNQKHQQMQQHELDVDQTVEDLDSRIEKEFKK